MVLFDIDQSFKGHFFNELRVSFKGLTWIWHKWMFMVIIGKKEVLLWITLMNICSTQEKSNEYTKYNKQFEVVSCSIDYTVA